MKSNYSKPAESVKSMVSYRDSSAERNRGKAKLSGSSNDSGESNFVVVQQTPYFNKDSSSCESERKTKEGRKYKSLNLASESIDCLFVGCGFTLVKRVC